MRCWLWHLALTIVLLSGCSSGDGSMSTQNTNAPDSQPPGTQPTTTPPATQPPPSTSPPPPAPIMNAGADQTVRVGELVTLHGTMSPAGPVCWQLLSQPSGSTAQLTIDQNDSLTVLFTPDKAGTYTVRLGCAEPFDSANVTAEEHVVVLRFSGTFGNDATIVGTFSYDSGLDAIATNAHNLQPNLLFKLRAWNFVVNAGTSGLPSTTYDSTAPNNTAEFCMGICIFSPTRMLRLVLANDSTMVLQLNFTQLDLSATHPPDSRAGWGPWVFGAYRVPASVPLVLLNDNTATLTQEN